MVLYYPGLQLPESPDFQLFSKSHPFEQYDAFYQDKFWFERLEKVGHIFEVFLKGLSVKY